MRRLSRIGPVTPQDFRVVRTPKGWGLELDWGAGWRPEGEFDTLTEAAREGRRRARVK
jgi:hypothetical protein